MPWLAVNVSCVPPNNVAAVLPLFFPPNSQHLKLKLKSLFFKKKKKKSSRNAARFDDAG